MYPSIALAQKSYKPSKYPHVNSHRKPKHDKAVITINYYIHMGEKSRATEKKERYERKPPRLDSRTSPNAILLLCRSYSSSLAQITVCPLGPFKHTNVVDLSHLSNQQ